MNKIFLAVLLTGAIVSCGDQKHDKQVNNEVKTVKVDDVTLSPNAKRDTSKKSIKAAAKGTIGGASIRINYHSPAVRGRTIWGGLVSYNEVWVTGAHHATNLEIDKDFVVGETTIPKGKYALFTIPGKDDWTIIINKNWEQHLADDYSQFEDVLRVLAKPENLNDKVERLEYFIEDKGSGKGEIAVAWDKIKVRFAITVL